MRSAIEIKVVDVSSPLIPVRILNEIAECIEQGRKNNDSGLVDLGKRLLQISSAWEDTMLYNCSIRTQNAWFEDYLNRWHGESRLPAVTDSEIGLAIKDVTDPRLKRIIENGYIPNFELTWVKFLVNLQLFGGVGTWEEICAYSGEDPQYLNKGGWLKFYLFYDMLRVFKRKKGGRVFELGETGQTIIDYATTH